MNWKLILLGIVVVAILGAVGSKFFGLRLLQGFQSGSGSSGAAPSENIFTMYYADWCPHCKSAKPEFKALMDKGEVKLDNGKKCKIRMIGLEENPEGVKNARMPINGFPSFLLESTDGEIYEYKGARNTDGYLKFINEKLGGGI